MNKLELIWELEKWNLKLESVKKGISDLNERNKDGKLENKLEKINKRLNRLVNNREIIKTHILKFENNLSQYEFEIKDLDNKLYKDNITDIKQLEYLSFEKEEFKKKLAEVETNMIIYMEEEEIIEKEYEKNRLMGKELEEELKQDNSIIEKEIKDLEEKLKVKEDKIKKIVAKIDKSALEIYNDLKVRKDRPIVLIKDNICSGCNMRLPNYQLEDLKIKDKILNCESCGRILYLRENGE